MSAGLSTKKLLVAFGIFASAIVGIFVLLVGLMFSFIEPTAIDDSDQDYLALQRFFRNPPTELMQSHLLDGSFFGDIEKAFAVRVTGMDTELLWQQQGVVRGDRLTAELDEAVEFIGNMLDSGYVDWFPSLDEIRRDSHYVYPINIVTRGGYPNAARLIIMRPFDDMAFFAYLEY
ncbi:MAG: hypothetical protein OXU66_06485 [Gammaproteobacteria bacterium]|nr:hypothetical protein [Gammaproteobacteria bacterium]MDD9894208.1 hypothetical protein [Gammaproteobacteria bacterium]MDD9958574.1 hypothetical protein [Gammaproteobacteria bacterium]